MPIGRDRRHRLVGTASLLVGLLGALLGWLGGGAARQAVRKDQEEAYGLGATSTPSFLINGRPVAGAQPIETFTEAIEAAEKAAK